MKSKIHNIETSLVTEYRKSAGIERLVLGSISNHLPEDSNGIHVAVRLKQNGVYVALKEADQTAPTEEVILEDDGSGYDWKLLEIFYSSKTADALSVGQFGEDTKIAPLIAVRNAIDYEVRSLNWYAKPFAKKEVIPVWNKKEGKDINREVLRLCFTVTENGQAINGSQTIIRNPSKEVLTEIFKLTDKVLLLNDEYRELDNENDRVKMNYDFYIYKSITDNSIIEKNSTTKKNKIYPSRIIDVPQKETEEGSIRYKQLFIKGIYVKRIDSLFDYDLGLDDIVIERNDVKERKMLDKIAFLLKNSRNTEVIEKLLRYAQTHPYSSIIEYKAFGYNPNTEKEFERKIQKKRDSFGYIKTFGDYKSNQWYVAFKRIYGENAVIASDFDMKNKDAKAMNHNPVRLNSAISRYLQSNGVLHADDITIELKYDWLSLEQLTENEARVLNEAKQICRQITKQELPEIRIYSNCFNAAGIENTRNNGVSIRDATGNSYVGLKKSLLDGTFETSNTLLHEIGHYFTKADDYETAFRDYFRELLTESIVKRIRKNE